MARTCFAFWSHGEGAAVPDRVSRCLWLKSAEYGTPLTCLISIDVLSMTPPQLRMNYTACGASLGLNMGQNAAIFRVETGVQRCRNVPLISVTPNTDYHVSHVPFLCALVVSFGCWLGFADADTTISSRAAVRGQS